MSVDTATNEGLKLAIQTRGFKGIAADCAAAGISADACVATRGGATALFIAMKELKEELGDNILITGFANYPTAILPPPDQNIGGAHVLKLNYSKFVKDVVCVGGDPVPTSSAYYQPPTPDGDAPAIANYSIKPTNSTNSTASAGELV